MPDQPDTSPALTGSAYVVTRCRYCCAAVLLEHDNGGRWLAYPNNPTCPNHPDGHQPSGQSTPVEEQR